jgi:serine/threonine-protein kinase RsbW
VRVPLQINKKTFRAQYDNLAEIATFIHPYCQDASLDNSSCYHVETAVDEACSNIIEHAYGGQGKGDIEICCQVNSGDITITLTDHGKTFEPDEIPEPDCNAPLEERENHGLGLFFIRKLMDKVIFSRGEDNSNILTLIKFKK